MDPLLSAESTATYEPSLVFEVKSKKQHCAFDEIQTVRREELYKIRSLTDEISNYIQNNGKDSHSSSMECRLHRMVLAYHVLLARDGTCRRRLSQSETRKRTRESLPPGHHLQRMIDASSNPHATTSKKRKVEYAAPPPPQDFAQYASRQSFNSAPQGNFYNPKDPPKAAHPAITSQIESPCKLSSSSSLVSATGSASLLRRPTLTSDKENMPSASSQSINVEKETTAQVFNNPTPRKKRKKEIVIPPEILANCKHIIIRKQYNAQDPNSKKEVKQSLEKLVLLLDKVKGEDKEIVKKKRIEKMKKLVKIHSDCSSKRYEGRVAKADMGTLHKLCGRGLEVGEYSSRPIHSESNNAYFLVMRILKD